MKRVFLYSALFILLEISPVKIVSLGQACTVAGALRIAGLRYDAYPFDWTVSPFESLYNALEDDFKNFLNEGSLTIRQFDRYGILDYYGFHFVHDFPSMNPNDEVADLIGESHVTGGILLENWRDFLPQVKAKYMRRIERLKCVLMSGEKVYLIRHYDTTKEQAIKLRDLIKQKYPFSSFVLVIVNNTHDIKNDWGLESIKNFYLNNSNGNEQAQWENIFKVLCI